MKKEAWKRFLQAHTCTAVGLGVSNLPLVDFLLELGAHVSVRDQKAREAFGALADSLEARGVKLFLGSDYLDRIDEDVIFRSPGLRPDLPAFVQAIQRGAVLTSEMELFLELTPATVIGITGSDGKTTTTTVTGLLLERECAKRGHGRVFVGGNIGEPLLPRVHEMTADDFAVVELSSFQLQTMRVPPMRSAMTNITPNHLNWHLDMDEYISAKTNIYRGDKNRLLVANAENAVTQRLAAAHAKAVTWFSSSRASVKEFGTLLKQGDRAVYFKNGAVTLWDGAREHAVLNADEILLPGKHNLENYMTAIALTDGYVTDETVREIATTFTGVRHRLERVRTVGGVTYYNSSIDSSPTRTAAALSALSQKPIVICGGYDKNIPFEPLADALCAQAKAVVLTGATAQKIREALEVHAEVQNGTLPICTEPDFTGAVGLAHDLAREGDTVLLSPACASFDAFPNFAARGDRFCEIVNGFSE